jgi:hypothetical protein
MALLSVLAAGHAAAQAVKPGLWEINNRMDGPQDPQMQQMLKAQQQQMAEMRRKLDSMPPAQRAQMETMLSQMNNAGKILGKEGMTMKVCITPEMAARQSMLENTNGNCKTTRSPAVGGVVKLSYTCTNPPASGEGTATFSGDSAYSMRMTMNMQQGGHNMPTTMASKGRFLSSSCGDVKPPAAYAPPAR